MKSIIVLAIFIAGCATPPATKLVSVAVVTSCIKSLPVRPNYETETISLKSSDGEKILALVRDWLKSRKYEVELEVVMEGCKG